MTVTVSSLVRHPRRPAKMRWLCLLLTMLGVSVQSQETTMQDLADRLPQTLRTQVFHGDARPFADRAWWTAQAATPYARQLLRAAEKELDTPLALPDDELYLDFSRTGNRDRYQTAYSTMQRAVTRIALAYCLSADPRFKARTLDALDRWLSLNSWLLPAHDHGNQTLQGKLETIELGSAALSWRLATLYRVWDREIPEPTRTQLREQLYRRTLNPFMEMIDGKRQPPSWLNGKSNWNAVCLTGVLGTLLAIEENPETRLTYTRAALLKINNSLLGFGDDGYCSEGVGYWNYGYGHNLAFALLIHAATDGHVNLMELPRMKAAGNYADQIIIGDTLVPTFADCHFNAKVSPRLLACRDALRGIRSPRLEPELPGFFHDDSLHYVTLPQPGHAPDPTPATLPPYTFFPSAGVAIMRPGPNFPQLRLAVAVKAGSNHELHNHNDVGSFIVALDNVPVLCDPGGEVYTRRTFSKDRYLSNLLNSFGHPVPLIDGKMQIPGPNTDSPVLEQRDDGSTCRFQADLAPAYANPNLTSMIRTLLYDRSGNGTLTVTDTATGSQPLTFETALIAPAPFQLRGNQVDITFKEKKLTVTITANAPFALDQQEILENSSARDMRFFRLAIRLAENIPGPSVTLTITPSSL